MTQGKENGWGKRVDERLVALERSMNLLQMTSERYQETLDKLDRVLNGDTSLNVPPLRDDVRELSRRIKGVYDWRWMIILLLVLNLGVLSAIVYLASLLG
jgi:hypothetical protein